MDSRAKQRITGAVILVAVFVLLVPELLKGPGTTPGATPAAASDETGLRSYTIDIDGPAKPVETAQAPTATVELPTPSTATPMAVPGEAAMPEAMSEESAGTAASTEVAAPMAGAAPPGSSPVAESTREPATRASAPAPTSSPGQASAPTPAATAAPRTETRPVIAQAPTAGGGFAVQLGSFSSRDNANRLVREMTAKGFAAFVAPITTNGRELFRVRVGPTRDRAAAEALAAQLRRIGQTGSIVSIS